MMRDFFNAYVRDVFPARRAAAGASWQWPGDEWASDALRTATWRWIVEGCPATLGQVVEIGPGAGKYTDLVLRFTAAHVTAFEISDAFITCLEQRCAGSVADERLRVRRIDWTDNEGLLRSHGGRRDIDLVLAIDVLMMMDFQSALVYLVSAAAMLRTGGRLLATFADAGSESGFARMMRDLGRHSATDPAPCTRFHWVDRTLLECVLPRLGFGSVSIVHGPDGGLDIARLYVSAELIDPERGARAAANLRPVGGDATNRIGPLA